MFKNFHKNKQNSGTTLIELLVVIFIFMTITSITIFNYGKFNSSLSIQNLADDIALTVRRAQGYAIGVRGYNESFIQGYGVHFTINPLTVGQEYKGSNKSFILFADIPPSGSPGNKKYDQNSGNCGTPVSNNECIEILSILSADEIKSITLSDGRTILKDGFVNVIFKRPNPEPSFYYSINGTGFYSDISFIKIRLESSGNTDIFKIITISNNGQISVSNNDNAN